MTDETIIKQMGAPSQEELPKINLYTRREFAADELYAFTVALCDNDIDRDGERFTDKALDKLATLFLGKTGIFNHSMDAQNQTARIFECHVEQDESRVNTEGQPYRRLVARAYLPKSAKNADFILELESGMKKEVSVGCAVKQAMCSVCGAQMGVCSHKKGTLYNGKTCHALLDEPTDAYEWSFVAVPAQREAGVLKSWNSGTHNPQTDSPLEKDAALGRAYRQELEQRVAKLCCLAQSEISTAVAQRLCAALDPNDLKALEAAFTATANKAYPLQPQLAPLTPAPPAADLCFKI